MEARRLVAEAVPTGVPAGDGGKGTDPSLLIRPRTVAGEEAAATLAAAKEELGRGADRFWEGMSGVLDTPGFPVEQKACRPSPFQRSVV